MCCAELDINRVTFIQGLNCVIQAFLFYISFLNKVAIQENIQRKILKLMFCEVDFIRNAFFKNRLNIKTIDRIIRNYTVQYALSVVCIV